MKTSTVSVQILTLGVAIIISACGSNATDIPVLALPTSTAPSILPTSSSTPLPSSTPALNPQDFFDTWMVWDQEAGGPNFLTFNEDGTFIATHGPLQGLVLHEGTYTLDGNEITFLNWWYCAPEQKTGTYLISMYPDNQSFRLLPVNDPCEERVRDFTKRIIKWNRFVPTPTP